MKILLVEDVHELRELVAMMIQSYFICDITECADGADAMMVLAAKKFDLVISDYNMPKKNGGDVFKFLRSQSATTPYIMLSSDHPSDHPEFDVDQFFGYIEKPFTDESIQEAINKLLPKQALEDTGEYVPISTTHLLTLRTMKSPLFIRLSDRKFVKAHASGVDFTKEEKEKYQTKGILHLYVARDQYPDFILEYKKTVLSKFVLSDFKPSEKIEYLAGDVEVVNQAAQLFGWNQEVISIANLNIDKVFYLTQKSKEFKSALSTLVSHTDSRLALHSILLSMAFAGVASHLKLTEEDLLKLTAAAILHDMSFDEDFFAEKINMLPVLNEEEFKNNPEIIRLKQHPSDTAQKIRQVTLLPITVDRIIAQHHERPDGSGFPMGLQNDGIEYLARIFIIAEDIIYNHIREQGASDPLQYLRRQKSVYAHSSFAPIFHAFEASLD